MKLGSKECNEALKGYKSKSIAEALMVELLLIPEDADDEVFADMTYRIIDLLTDREVETLDIVVTKIRNNLGID